jgi:hypothetical protein
MSAPTAERPPASVDLATTPRATPSACPTGGPGCCRPGDTEAKAVRRRERRGLATVVGASAICPCHLPLTLALLGTALGGTAGGVFLREHVWLAGSVITLVWAALTWRGLWLVRKGRSCPVPGRGGLGCGPGCGGGPARDGEGSWTR